MGATGICFDNSPAEAFFASLKRELVHRRRFATRAEARREIIRWIEGWYNARRLHSSLNYLTPIEKGPLRTYARPGRIVQSGRRRITDLSVKAGQLHRSRRLSGAVGRPGLMVLSVDP
jgi:hypothetical protein